MPAPRLLAIDLGHAYDSDCRTLADALDQAAAAAPPDVAAVLVASPPATGRSTRT